MTRHCRASLAACLSLALAIAFASACSQESPDKNPVIRTKFKETEDDLKGAKLRLDTVEMEIDVLNKDVANMKNELASAAGGPAQAQKIAGLEKQNQDLRNEIESLKKTVAELKVESAARPVGRAAAEAPAEAKAAPAGKTRSGAGAEARKVDRKQAGTYYKVKEGDTVSSIASAHGLSPQDLRAANRLPATVEKLAVGVSLFVPSAR